MTSTMEPGPSGQHEGRRRRSRRRSRPTSSGCGRCPRPRSTSTSTRSRDIDWDHPDYAIDPTDERWILPEADVLGRHPWYRALPKDEQIRIGLYRQANVTKVGLQFEQILIAGLMNYAFTLPNGSPEFRYSTHEATEECHHTQMFQEFVNRSGQDVPGGSAVLPRRRPVLPLAASWCRSASSSACWPARSRSTTCRSRSCAPATTCTRCCSGSCRSTSPRRRATSGSPTSTSQHNAPELKRHERAVLSVAVPIIMRWLCDEILVPTKQAQRDMGIPEVGRQGPLLGPARVAEDAARPLRRRADARRGHRHDEPGLAPGLAADEDRRPPARASAASPPPRPPDRRPDRP